MKRVLILGLGNPLLGDEGVGLRVIEALKALVLPEGVAVVEGGTAGLGLLALMEGYQRVIAVDAADMGHPPGSVLRFTPAEVEFERVEGPLSLHQVGLAEVLALAEALQVAPAGLVIVGIQPGCLEVAAGLSAEVEGAIPRAVELILGELGLTAADEATDGSG